MTEVRSTSSSGVGLFATRDFAVGEVILKEESPLIVLSSSLSTSLLASPLTAKKGSPKQTTPTAWESIVPPSSILTHYEGTFKGMIQAAVAYAEQEINDEIKDQFLQLYHPQTDSTEEQEIIQISSEALAYLEQNSKGSLQSLVSSDPQLIRSIMLTWSCNSFAGGKIYLQHSRINHSCDPNAVVQPLSGDGQCLRAATAITAGTEVTISYLGLFLYADRLTRQRQLQTHKHFVCGCARCLTYPDRAAAIPCPVCHKRNGRYLDEDVQYDDEATVQYAMPISSTAVECSHCQKVTTMDNNPNHVLQLANTVSDKVMTHLDSHEDDSQVDEEWQDQLLQLAGSVLGARHWTTNLLLLTRLDRSLQELHSNMITTGAVPKMMEVAELIDSLQRVCLFVDGLELNLHMGHVLGNAVIGIARTLVALGDVKSKKYASEWLEKINDYVLHFETDDMKKVVQTLQLAWQQQDDSVGEGNYSNKRAKIT